MDRDASIRRTYLVAWLGGPVIGIVNGAARELLLKGTVSESAARQISTGTAIALFAGYLWILEGRWPIPTNRDALEIGAVWVALTVVFEFSFGHYLDGKSWTELFGDYNVATGHLWPLVPISLGVGPLVIRGLRRRRERQQSSRTR